MSAPVLSVVIACYNDPDITNTVQSLWNSVDDVQAVEVVIVDDCSSRPFSVPVSRVIRNTRRIGCGPSRYVGALAAKGQWLLFVDAHSRFPAGWFDVWARQCGMASKTLYCGSCLALPPDNDVTKCGGQYWGATWNFAGADRNKARATQVLECVWGKEQTGPGTETGWDIPAIMGACYFIRRDWFIELGALKYLKFWSGDEQQLSLKVMLSGGTIRFMKNVRIGHRFRDGPVPAGFVMPQHITYNKLFIAWTCLPPECAQRLQERLQREPQYRLASRAIQADWHLVETERAYNSQLFTRSFRSFLDQFSLSFPDR
jgi:glycosyltransferase involved in cell wall biosynthesis